MRQDIYLNVNMLGCRMEVHFNLNYHLVMDELRAVDWSGDTVHATIMGYIIRASKKDCMVTVWEVLHSGPDHETVSRRYIYKDLYRGGTFDDIYPMPWGGIYD